MHAFYATAKPDAAAEVGDPELPMLEPQTDDCDWTGSLDWTR